MSQSTNGQICYGIIFEGGFPFPWEHYSEQEWWREVNGFKQATIYDKNDPSGFKGGRRPAESVIDAYYDEMHAWDKANPMPVTLVNYCSDSCPMYIIAIVESFKNCTRGYPQEINPSDLKVTDEQRQKVIDFCETYLKEAIDKYNNDSGSV